MYGVIVDEVVVFPNGKAHILKERARSFATFADATIEAQAASERYGTAFIIHRCKCGHVEVPDIRRNMLVRCSRCLAFRTI